MRHSAVLAAPIVLRDLAETSGLSRRNWALAGAPIVRRNFDVDRPRNQSGRKRRLSFAQRCALNRC
jgi:hypothetical protein